MRASDRFFLKLGDLFLVWIGLILAVLIRTDLNWPRTLLYLEDQTWFFLVLSSAVVLIFWMRGFYGRDWRYLGISDVIDLAVTLAVVMLPFEIVTLTALGVAFPRTGLLIAYFPILFFLAGIRGLIRISIERRRRGPGGLRYFVLGADDAAELAVRELARSGGRAVGLVSVDKGQLAPSIRGCPYLGDLSQIGLLFQEHRVDGLILAGLEPAQNSKVVRETAGLDVQLRIIPAVPELLKGEVEVSTLRPLRLEDLLARETVALPGHQVGGYLQGQVVLVTGAGGSIGSEIVRQILPLGPATVLLLGRGENSIHEILTELQQTFRDTSSRLVPVIADVRSEVAVRSLFESYRPGVVFHAAAHKHVPLMEEQPVEACSNNIFGTLTLMKLCEEFAVRRLVVLSTDKAVSPSSVMGATKRVTELLVHTSGLAGVSAVRFGNVLGSRGSVVPTLQRQIERGGPVTITSPDMRRYFMTIPEAVSLVLAAGAVGEGGEIYVLEMGEPVKIVDLAENLIRLSGLTPHQDIEIVYCGVRPGEKLDEELVYSQESSAPSELPGVVRVAPKSLAKGWPGQGLDKLREAVQSGDEEAARQALFQLLD